MRHQLRRIVYRDCYTHTDTQTQTHTTQHNTHTHTRMYLSGKKIDGVISFVELCTETAAKVAECVANELLMRC